MAEFDQKLRPAFECATVVHVDPRIGQIHIRRPPVHHEGQADPGQKRDAFVVDHRAMHDDAIHRAARLNVFVGAGLVTVRYQLEHHVIARPRITFSGPRDEIAEHGVHHLMLIGDRDHVSNGKRTACRKPLGTQIGPIIEILCSLQNAGAGAFADFGISVQRATHSGLRQVKMFRKLLEIHGIFQSALIFAYRLDTKSGVRKAPLRAQNFCKAA